jgi:hypothetical protein
MKGLNYENIATSKHFELKENVAYVATRTNIMQSIP